MSLPILHQRQCCWCHNKETPLCFEKSDMIASLRQINDVNLQTYILCSPSQTKICWRTEKLIYFKRCTLCVYSNQEQGSEYILFLELLSTSDVLFNLKIIGLNTKSKSNKVEVLQLCNEKTAILIQRSSGLFESPVLTSFLLNESENQVKVIFVGMDLARSAMEWV